MINNEQSPNINNPLEQADSDSYAKKFESGLTEEIVKEISKRKNEPQWVLDIRLKALKIFHEKKWPSFGPDLSKLDLNKIRYFATTDQSEVKNWEDVDPEIKRTFDYLRIPEAEKEYLAGVGAQYESDPVYHRLKDVYAQEGVIFEDFGTAIEKYPEIVKKYFTKCIPLADHKFSALHYAVFSGGSFLYIPKGKKVPQPIQAYFRMNARNQGQFEHTLIILEEESEAHYIEGCSAPIYDSNSLHAGCVEIFVEKNAKMQYSSIENWSKNTYNLNTKRAIVSENARIEWIGGNFGSAVTMLYPCSILKGNNAVAEHFGVAYAGKDQNQDTGAKIICLGKNNKARVVSKGFSKDGGVSSYRGIVSVAKNADNALIHVDCDAILWDEESVSDTFPEISCQNTSSQITHEAKAGKISEEIIFYLQTRGIPETKARALVINGFFDEVLTKLPLEYALELNRLIEMETE